MKKIKLVTFCMLFGSSLFAQTIKDHRSFAWKLMRGSDGKDINVDSYGRFTLVNTVGKFYTYKGPDWEEAPWALPKSPTQKLSVQLYAENRNGVVFANNKISAYRIYRRMVGDVTLTTQKWDTIGGGPTLDLTVGTDSTIWSINGNKKIYCIYPRANSWSSWYELPGIDGSRIAAGGGQVWAISTAGKIYRHKNPKNPNAGWEQMPGSDGRDITVANDGSIWLVNTVGKIYRWYGTGWTQQPGSDGYRIAANNGKVVLINTAGKMYYGEY